MTESRRRNDRDKAKEKAQELVREGKIEEARREFSKAVTITHDHAVELMRQCQSIGVDCIVAMYEADSQLAYLNKIGLADYVVSEDSDLILFGAQKILFKLQIDGRCTLFESSKLPQALGVSEDKFDFDKFRRICILSGCDYLDSLPGIGLSKARKFMLMTEETDMRRALPKIPSYLNMRKLTVTDEYVDGFLKAEATFKHMFVYDPVKREMLRLNPLDEDTDEEDCVNAGKILKPEQALQIALGNLNPRNLEVCNNFNPDQCTSKNKFSEQSIWGNSKYKKTTTKLATGKQQKLSSFFSKSNKKLSEVQNIAQSENEVTSSVELTDLVSSYVFNALTPKASTKHRIDSEEEQENENHLSKPYNHNPFMKRSTGNNTPVVIKQNEAKVSKYFAAKSEKAKVISTDQDMFHQRPEAESENSSFEENDNKPDCSNSLFKFERVSRKSLSLVREKVNTNNHVEMEVDDETLQISENLEVDDTIDVDNYHFTAKSSSQFSSSSTNSIKIGLSKNFKKPSKKPIDVNQTLLSRFGFEKRTSVK